MVLWISRHAVEFQNHKTCKEHLLFFGRYTQNEEIEHTKFVKKDLKNLHDENFALKNSKCN